MLKVRVASNCGTPLSLAVKFTVEVLGAWAGVGVHWKRPDPLLRVAPKGMPVAVKVSVWPASGSVALAVKDNVSPRTTYLSLMGSRLGVWFAPPATMFGAAGVGVVIYGKGAGAASG